MIVYFSATGNSLHVAKSIALPGEEFLSITEAEKEKRYQLQVNDGRLGIISPTYDFTLPNIVSSYLEKLELSFDEKPYLFYVGTYGTTTGAAGALAACIAARRTPSSADRIQESTGSIFIRKADKIK